MSVIREAATRYPSSAWVSYDQQFRLRQAYELTRQSWGSLNGELWLRVMSNPAQHNTLLKQSAESAPNNGQSKHANMLSMRGIVHGKYVCSTTIVQRATLRCMVNLTAYIYGNDQQTGQSGLCPTTLYSFSRLGTLKKAHHFPK